MSETIVEAVMARLAAAGVRHVFGVPGGDCNLDFIEAGERVGITFVLTRQETPAAFMAGVTANLTGAPGVVMTTRGPGFANAMNGIAGASLDRAPIVLIADAYEPDLDYVPHQRIDQAAMAAPVLRGFADLDGDDPLGDLDALLAAAGADPPGPVYLETTGRSVRREAPPHAVPGPSWRARAASAELGELDTVRATLAAASRPAIIAGIQALDAGSTAALRRLSAQWNCPVFPTYMAKGVTDDVDARTLGYYIGGVSEAQGLFEADCIVLFGFDPIECTPQTWRYRVPVVELTTHRHPRHLVADRITVVGPLDELAAAVADARGAAEWTLDELTSLKEKIRAAAYVRDGRPISPQVLVEACAAVAPAHTRITVDAGAHMLPVMHLWSSANPRDVLISRGLATMGYALPAGIASSLAEPGRPVVCFTGDGGIMMNPAELATAVQYGCNLVVAVFNDSLLSLIAAKQARRGLARAGVAFSASDFAKVAEGFGAQGIRVERPEALEPAFARAFAHEGVSVVDVVVDPRGYDEEIIAVRG